MQALWLGNDLWSHLQLLPVQDFSNLNLIYATDFVSKQNPGTEHLHFDGAFLLSIAKLS